MPPVALSSLPDELVNVIARKLNNHNVLRLARTSKSVRRATGDAVADALRRWREELGQLVSTTLAVARALKDSGLRSAHQALTTAANQFQFVVDVIGDTFLVADIKSAHFKASIVHIAAGQRHLVEICITRLGRELATLEAAWRRGGRFTTRLIESDDDRAVTQAFRNVVRNRLRSP